LIKGKWPQPFESRVEAVVNIEIVAMSVLVCRDHTNVNIEDKIWPIEILR
jgi:hypothetical protein